MGSLNCKTINPTVGPICFIIVWLFAAPLQAGPLFELTGGNQGRGGFNARVIGASSASTYFNPALLPYADTGLEVGVFLLTDQISIDVEERPDSSYDVPEGVRLYGRENGSPLTPMPIPTDWLENGVERTTYSRDAHPRQSEGSSDNTRVYQVVGLINQIFDDQLVIGLHAMIPLSGFTAASAFYSDEREQFFSNSLHPELYSDRLTAAELAFGLASRIYKRLAVGMSFTLNLENHAVTPTYVSDAGRLNDTLIDSRIDVTTTVSPHFGVVFDAHDRVRLIATIHTPQSMQIKTNFTYLLNNGQEQGSSIAFTHGYLPWSAGLGASYDLLKPKDLSGKAHALTFVSTLLFCDWTDYRDRHNERSHTAYSWSKVLTPSIGVRHSYQGIGSFLDLLYAPTPIPPQTGRTNYVDNDRLGFNGGVEYQFPFFNIDFRAGVQTQLHYLFRRSQRKLNGDDDEASSIDSEHLVIDEVPDDAIDNDNRGEPAEGREGLQTNNPGWPGFSSDGWLLGGGLYLAFLF